MDIVSVSITPRIADFDPVLSEITAFSFENLEDLETKISSFSWEIFDTIYRFGRLHTLPIRLAAERFQRLRYQSSSMIIKIRMIVLTVSSIPNIFLAIPGMVLCLFIQKLNKNFAYSPSTHHPDFEQIASHESVKDKPEIEESSYQLKIMSWNTGLGPGFMSIDNCLKIPAERVLSILKTIDDQNPHIIALQEVFDVDAIEAMVKQLNEKGYDCIHSILSTSPIALSSGLLLAVKRESSIKLRLEKVRIWQFKNLADMDVFSNKALLGVKIQVLGKGKVEKSLFIYNTHLQSSYGPRGYGEVRLQQVIAIVKKINDWIRTNHDNVILCGDLNFAKEPLEVGDDRILKPVDEKNNHQLESYDEYDIQLKELAKVHLFDPNSKAQLNQQGSFYHLRGDAPQRSKSVVDYVLISESLRSAHDSSTIIDLDFLKSPPSDHLPILTSLNM